MVMKEEVEKVVKFIVDEKFICLIDVDEKGNVIVILVKDIFDIDNVLIKFYFEIGKLEGVGLIIVNCEREIKEVDENVQFIEEMVFEKFKEVIDFEIGFDVVNFGLIYDFKVNFDNMVYVKMMMMILGCLFIMWFFCVVEDKILEIFGVKDVEIEFIFDLLWMFDRISFEYKKKLGFF